MFKSNVEKVLSLDILDNIFATVTSR